MKATEKNKWYKGLGKHGEEIKSCLVGITTRRLESGNLKDEKGNPLKSCICPLCLLGCTTDLIDSDCIYEETKNKYKKNYKFGQLIFEEAMFIMHLALKYGSMRKYCEMSSDEHDSFMEDRMQADKVYRELICDDEDYRVAMGFIVESALAVSSFKWNKSWEHHEEEETIDEQSA